MPRFAVRTLLASAAGGLVLACAPAVARRDTSTAPPRETRGVRTRGVRTAALDSATARRLCVAPDSVAAGRAPCVLRDQRPPVRVF